MVSAQHRVMFCCFPPHKHLLSTVEVASPRPGYPLSIPICFASPHKFRQLLFLVIAHSIESILSCERFEYFLLLLHSVVDPQSHSSRENKKNTREAKKCKTRNRCGANEKRGDYENPYSKKGINFTARVRDTGARDEMGERNSTQSSIRRDEGRRNK